MPGSPGARRLTVALLIPGIVLALVGTSVSEPVGAVLAIIGVASSLSVVLCRHGCIYETHAGDIPEGA
ncbi:MAG: hypothetical protein ACOC2N_03140 [Spirochaetota bacterium]